MVRRPVQPNGEMTSIFVSVIVYSHFTQRYEANTLLMLQIGSSTLVDDLIQFTSDIEEHLRVKEVDFADGIVEVVDIVTDVVG